MLNAAENCPEWQKAANSRRKMPHSGLVKWFKMRCNDYMLQFVILLKLKLYLNEKEGKLIDLKIILCVFIHM